jgi:hypothetical protein
MHFAFAAFCVSPTVFVISVPEAVVLFYVLAPDTRNSELLVLFLFLIIMISVPLACKSSCH